jgi:hypothetical protein
VLKDRKGRGVDFAARTRRKKRGNKKAKGTGEICDKAADMKFLAKKSPLQKNIPNPLQTSISFQAFSRPNQFFKYLLGNELRG